ncbi:helix-turn-helix domain-containing protein [Paraeggerthella sp. Marseille-Q4926]|nr:helix-turn-helix transcriptional regulator [Paraeggerthella sp. Marseille-Q4926]
MPYDKIMNYENGKGGIGYETAWALADLFGVTPDYLMGWDERKAG